MVDILAIGRTGGDRLPDPRAVAEARPAVSGATRWPGPESTGIVVAFRRR